MLPAQPYDERELLKNISEGDESAFAIFFNEHYPRLRPFISKFIADQVQIEDALQEIFIRVWLNRDQLPEIENIHAWLHTLSSRICINALRKQLTIEKYAKDTPVHATHHMATPEEQFSFSEVSRTVAEAINKMPRARKRIYLLSRQEGLKPAEIAGMLSLSVNTVRNVLVTALKEIREYLVANGHDLNLIFLMGIFLFGTQ